jgi:hypothetical protein
MGSEADKIMKTRGEKESEFAGRELSGMESEGDKIIPDGEQSDS